MEDSKEVKKSTSRGGTKDQIPVGVPKIKKNAPVSDEFVDKAKSNRDKVQPRTDKDYN